MALLIWQGQARIERSSQTAGGKRDINSRVGGTGLPKKGKLPRRLGKILLIAVLIVPLFAGILLFGYRAFQQQSIRGREAISTPRGVDSLERVVLGGAQQWILIRGEDRSNPVLLWLHGGPGSPSLPLAQRHDSKLLKHFVVVHWDQRGAGKSYSGDLSPDDLTVDRFVSDAHELTQLLCDRFDRTQIYLIGHSWGSTVGILAAARYPDSYRAFIGVGQAVHSEEEDAVGYRFAMGRAAEDGNRKAVEDLDSIGQPPWESLDDVSTYARWINAFGGTGRQFSIWNYMRDVITSPSYSIKDVFKCFRGQQFSVEAMLANGQLNRVNLFNDVPELKIPVYFFQGRFDYNTPGEVVERYFNELCAPRKSLIWFEQSAHFPQWEEPAKFADELLKVLKET